MIPRLPIVLYFILFILGCTDEHNPKPYPLVELQGNGLGTTWSVKILTKQIFKAEELRNDIIQKLEDTEKIFSHWRRDAALYQFNTAQTTSPISLHPQLLALLKHAQWVNLQSDGAFDPTLAPVVNLWGFGPVGKTRTTLPTDKQINETLSSTGIKNIELLPTGLVRKKVPTLQLDFSGSAKGEIIDQTCALLERWNFKNYLVEIGGEVRAHGKGKNGKGWVVGLENGGANQDSLEPVTLRNYAVATSGTYRLKKPNPKTKHSASHLMNPRTGRPIDHALIAVNAFAPTAKNADAWATALMILGPKEGMKKAEQLDMVARFCTYLNGEISIAFSPAYKTLYQKGIQ